MNVTKTNITLPMAFHCHEKIDSKDEDWDGSVCRFKNHGSHYEIQIESRSGFTFMIGKYINGGFISIPAYGVGCDLAGYGDYFWNYERLSNWMNRVDAVTVAEALRTLQQNNYI